MRNWSVWKKEFHGGWKATEFKKKKNLKIFQIFNWTKRIPKIQNFLHENLKSENFRNYCQLSSEINLRVESRKNTSETLRAPQLILGMAKKSKILPKKFKFRKNLNFLSGFSVKLPVESKTKMHKKLRVPQLFGLFIFLKILDFWSPFGILRRIIWLYFSDTMNNFTDDEPVKIKTSSCSQFFGKFGLSGSICVS